MAIAYDQEDKPEANPLWYVSLKPMIRMTRSSYDVSAWNRHRDRQTTLTTIIAAMVMVQPQPMALAHGRTKAEDAAAKRYRMT